MATKPKAEPATTEESAYATGPDQPGKPVGPEHDGSFSAPDFYDADGKRIETDWDTEAQKNDPGIPPVEDASGGEGGEVTPSKPPLGEPK